MSDYFRDLADGRWRRWQTSSRPRERPFDARAAVAATMARAMERAAEENRQEEADRAAWHEAGHAYGLWIQGYPFAEASIDSTGHGRTVHMGGGPAWSIDSAAIVLAAGAAGERLAYPNVHDGCDEDDERLAAILADNPDAEPELRRRCEQLVRDGKEAIGAVARVLLARGHISGEDAAAVFSEHKIRRAEPTTRPTPGERKPDGRTVRTLPPQPELRGQIRVIHHTHVIESSGRSWRTGWDEYPEEGPYVPGLPNRKAVQAYNQMNRAGDREDWDAHQRYQYELLAITDAARRAA